MIESSFQTKLPSQKEVDLTVELIAARISERVSHGKQRVIPRFGTVLQRRVAGQQTRVWRNGNAGAVVRDVYVIT